LQKKDERGSFEGSIYNAWVEMDADNKNTTYYLNRPDAYPEIKIEQ
jgi:hypothetical protein